MKTSLAVAAFAIVTGCIAGAADSPKSSSPQSTPPAASAPAKPCPADAKAKSPSDKTSSEKKNAKPADCAVIASAKPAPAPQAPQNAASQLESVLNSMDKASAGFKTVQSSFEWINYTKLVDESETQDGTIYFRRLSSDSVEMGAHIEKPSARIVVFSDGVVQIYEPKMDTITRYSAGKNRQAFESFLVLGFGGRGHDLSKSFEVSYGGSEMVDGVNAAILQLVPKEPSVKNMFNQIALWIDPARGVSVQQKLTQPNGDYRLAKYKDIRVNQKLPDDAFKIKTTKKTKVVTPNG